MQCSCALLIRFHFDEISHSYSSLTPKEMVLFHFFSQHSLFIFLCQVVFCLFGALTWLSSSSSRSRTKAGAESGKEVGAITHSHGSQCPEQLIRGMRLHSWIVPLRLLLILFHLIAHLTWGVRSVPGSLLGFVSFSLYFTSCKKEPGLKELT